jgi:hypothetical protein
MTTPKNALLACFLSLFLGSVAAQHFSDKHVSSLIINTHDSLTFMGDTLVIDTLQMQDHSKLQLTSNTYMLVKNAFLGEEVTISASGQNGQSGKDGFKDFLADGGNGIDGTTGNDLLLVMSFNQLGSLTITTDGGNGGDGGNGFSPFQNRVGGERGFDGGNGGKGGAGKDAGNLTFYYKYTDFIPRFNREGPHAIHFSIKGGTCGNIGLAGKGGTGGPMQAIRDPVTNQVIYTTPKGTRGTDGLTGGECFAGVDGELFFKKLNKSID